jgi:hypothetical protein
LRADHPWGRLAENCNITSRAPVEESAPLGQKENVEEELKQIINNKDDNIQQLSIKLNDLELDFINETK